MKMKIKMKMKIFMKKVLKILKNGIRYTLEIIYVPVYILAWLFHKIIRFVLAIDYIFLFDFKKSKDIIKYLFKNNEPNRFK